MTPNFIINRIAELGRTKASLVCESTDPDSKGPGFPHDISIAIGFIDRAIDRLRGIIATSHDTEKLQRSKLCRDCMGTGKLGGLRCGRCEGTGCDIQELKGN